VIIIAAGEGSRWGNYRDTPKHLTVVEKEVLLHRTCSQFLKYTDDVCVIGADERYAVENTSLYIIKTQNTHWGDAAKFMSSKHLWSQNSRTVLVFGDVYFTNDAVKKIMTDKDPFKFFLRKDKNEETGARWKEIFALTFDASSA
jgi:choline kinase